MFNFFAEKKLLNSAQVVSTKMPKNEAKTYRNNFLWLFSALSFCSGRCTGYRFVAFCM